LPDRPTEDPGDKASYALLFAPTVTDSGVPGNPDANYVSETTPATVQDVPGTCRSVAGGTLDSWIVTVNSPAVGAVMRDSGKGSPVQSGQYKLLTVLSRSPLTTEVAAMLHDIGAGPEARKGSLTGGWPPSPAPNHGAGFGEATPSRAARRRAGSSPTCGAALPAPSGLQASGGPARLAPSHRPARWSHAARDFSTWRD
jgi:hypothetical protein